MSAFSRLPVPFLHPVNGSGTPYPLAKAYFYVAGTTTPQDTYSDKDLTIPNTNPVVADANGLFGQIFLGSGTYDVALKTSADATIWTAEDVAAAAVSAATTTVSGIIELATTAEALTGSSTTLGMTPATVAAAVQQGFSYGTTGGSANAITVTPTIAPTALASGMECYFRASSTNTGATTINYAGLGAVSARVHGASGATACVGGEIITNNVYKATYSGADSCWLVAAVGWTPAALTALTAETSLAVGDEFLMYDVSGFVPKKITVTSMAALQADMEAGTALNRFATAGNLKWHDGVAKAWCFTIYAAGVPNSPGQDSYNISSVTDQAVGKATFNFTTAFSSANYSAQSNNTYVGTSSSGEFSCVDDAVAQATTSVCIRSMQTGASGNATLQDIAAFHLAVFGDQS
jgi:hypothetical protein